MKLIKNVGAYFSSNILNALIPFFLLPILTRNLTVSDYGQVMMFQTLLSALSVFVGFSSSGIAVRKFYDNDTSADDLKCFNGACLQILLISTLFLIFLCYFFNEMLANFLSIPAVWVYYALMISVMSYIVTIRLGQWQVRNEKSFFFFLQTGNSIVNMLLSVFLVVFLNMGGQGRIDALLITGIVFATISIILLYRSNLLKLMVWRFDSIKEILFFGVPLLPHAIGSYFLNIADRIIINKELGSEQVGIYFLAVQLSSTLLIVFDAVNKAYVPWLFDILKENNIQNKLKIVKTTYLYMAVLMLLALLSFLVGPYLVDIISGDKYKEARSIIGWLCLGQILSGMYLMVTNYIFFAKKTHYLSLATIVSGVFGVVCLIYFVESFGLLGAAISFVLAKFIHFSLTFYMANKVYPMPWSLKNDHES